MAVVCGDTVELWRLYADISDAGQEVDAACQDMSRKLDRLKERLEEKKRQVAAENEKLEEELEKIKAFKRKMDEMEGALTRLEEREAKNKRKLEAGREQYDLINRYLKAIETCQEQLMAEKKRCQSVLRRGGRKVNRYVQFLESLIADDESFLGQSSVSTGTTDGGGKGNIQRMGQGMPPVGNDGLPANLNPEDSLFQCRRSMAQLLAGAYWKRAGSSLGKPKLVPDRTTPRDLVETRFGFTEDSDGNMVYDSPLEMDEYLYKTQGSARKEYQGTCGLCSCANILRLAGVNVTEEEVIAYASTTRDETSLSGMLCALGHSKPGMNGGTSAKTRKQILEHFGIDSGTFLIAYDSDNSISQSNIDRIADAVSSGKGVILSVHADLLWKDEKYDGDYYHAVTVTSVKKDKDGRTEGFYICDSANNGTHYYPADKVLRCLTGSPMNITHGIIR